MLSTISSFGIILYCEIEMKKHILICKRIASLQFLDIFNSRCPLNKIEQYIPRCSEFEKKMLIADNIDDIYRDCFANHRSYEEIQIRWKKIRPYVQSVLRSNVKSDPSCLYSFPKGKRRYSETGIDAAIREFEEETNIDINLIEKTDHDPYSVSFRGSDDKYYKTTYFVYKCERPIYVEKTFINSPFTNRQYRISEEMEDLLWIPIEDASKYLDSHVVKILSDITL